jgi:hypothetical protein
MASEGSLPRSQQPTICTYIQSHLSSPRPHPISWNPPILILSSQTCNDQKLDYTNDLANRFYNTDR